MVSGLTFCETAGICIILGSLFVVPIVSQNVTCPQLDVKDGAGSVTYYNGSGDLGTIAKYVCADGFVLQGAITRRCDPPGQWSGTDSTCIDDVDGLPTSPPTSGHLLAFSGIREWTGEYEHGGTWVPFEFDVTYVDSHLFGRLDGWFVWGTQEDEKVYLTGYFDTDQRLKLRPVHNVTGLSVFHSPEFGLDGRLKSYMLDTFVFLGDVTMDNFGGFAMWGHGAPVYDGHRTEAEAKKSATIVAVCVSLVLVLIFLLASWILYWYTQDTQSGGEGGRSGNRAFPPPSQFSTEPDFVVLGSRVI